MHPKTLAYCFLLKW